MKRAILLLVCLGFGCASPRWDGASPGSPEEDAPPEKKGWSKEQKLIAVNAAVAGAVLVYGIKFWDYGSGDFQFENEGWFQADTHNGGSDKLGHAYTGYVGALGLAAIYEGFGYERSKADLYGALTSMGAMTGIELADGLSRYRFSWEDLIADGLGVLGGYWRRRVPAVGRYVDYRVEYWPSATAQGGDHSDFATDYSAFKYVLALKLDAFEKLRPTALSWFELQVGYYTRGYGAGDENYYDGKSRTFYVAIGINLQRLFSKAGLRGLGQIFQYYQPKYTYLPYDWTLPQ